MNRESTSLPSTPIFRPFNPNAEVKVYFRNLPHWRQQGATYFVTFRQADSIPKGVLAEWLDIRQRWYRAHNLEPSQREADPECFAAGYLRIPKTIRRAFEKQQAKMLHEELDRCHGSCALRGHEIQSEVAEALKYFHGERLWLGDFVLITA
jgi:putative transposase